MPESGSALVELDGISKTYLEGEQRRPVFEDLHAALPRGSATVLMGRSGSGKSTLLNLISGIDLPDRGEIRFDGIALTGLDDRARTLHRRRRIGFVFQFFNLIPTLSVEENVRMPLEFIGRSRGRSALAARRLLADLGLESRADSFPDRLSGGEQQRVAVARALVHDPDLVLADEPTGNLDTASGREVLSLLTGLVRDAGKTLLIATHSEEAREFADRVLEFKNGRLAESA